MSAVHTNAGRLSYYGDFVAYAVLLGALAIGAGFAAAQDRWVWLAATVAGIGAWTLLEYVIHRFVFHAWPPAAKLHGMHHLSPRAYVSTPTWISLSILGGLLFLPSWTLGSLPVALGLVSGIAAGYFWYGIVHHVIHHGRPLVLARMLRGVARRHGQHHATVPPRHFGVTTAFWDRVFRTLG